MNWHGWQRQRAKLTRLQKSPIADSAIPRILFAVDSPGIGASLKTVCHQYP
jgi:hypothetical protein